MAEQLPTYSRAGIGYADLPRLVTEDIEMGAKTWGNIGEKLDRLRAFAQGKAEDEAIAQAKKFAAANPVTKEQVEAAKNPAGVVESFLGAFTGKGGTVYRQALSEAQGVVLGNDLALDANAKMLQIKEDAKNGLIDFDTARLEIQDMMDGYRATVASFNPEAAIKLQATLATAGNNTLKTISDIESKKMDAVITAGFENAMPQLARTMEDMYYMGDQFDPESQTWIMADDLAATQTTALVEKAVGYNKTEYVAKIYEAQRQAKINGIARGLLDPEFAANASAAYQMMRNNNMGKYQATWNGMSDDERQKTIDRVLKTVADQKKVADDNATIQKGGLIMEAQRIQGELYTMPLSPQERQGRIGRLIQINGMAEQKVTSNSELKAFQTGKTDENKASDEMMYSFERFVDSGQLTDDQIAIIAENSGMSWDQARSLRNRRIANQRKDVTAATQMVTQAFNSMQTPYNKNQIQQVEGDVKREIIEASEDPNVDPRDLAKNKIAETEQQLKSEQREKDYNSLVLLIQNNFDVADPEKFAEQLIENPDLLMDMTDDPAVIRQIQQRLKRLK
jgi:hypothetical protein